MILTEIGEIGVHVGDDVHILRPSLYAMSQIGEPADIVRTYATLVCSPVTKAEKRQQFISALHVIHCCAQDDLDHVFGYFNDRMKYVVKMADMRDIVPLGAELIRHGVTGILPKIKRSGGGDEYTTEFHARDHVATAMAHLGMTEQEAWSTTMTALVSALRSKYPEQKSNEPGDSAPAAEEHDAAMSWYDRVEAKRKTQAV